MRRPISTTRKAGPISSLAQWKLEDAKARLSEVVRRAASEGPQLVTVRGKQAAIIVDPETYRQLLPQPADFQPLADFLRTLDLSGIDVERDVEIERELVL